MNKVILMGRLTRDPDVRYSQNGNQTAVARFSIAVDRRFKRDGEAEADFFNCTAFGKTGEFVEKYLHKGTKVVLSGRIQNDNYTNREGQMVYGMQIIAEDLEFAESKNASSGGGNYSANANYGGSSYGNANAGYGGGYSSSAKPAPSPVDDGFINIPDGVDDEDLPF